MSAPEASRPDDGTGGTGPVLSVIVPAYNGTGVLPRCLDALQGSDLERDAYEVIVVDDASSDGTADLAASRADRVIRLEDGPNGPAYARNAGSREARAPVLLFVDADTCVHPDTLRRVRDVFASDPDLDAVFGAYDDTPEESGFVSQYRNLYHRYVHLRGEGEAETFWAGCGAVRTEAFMGVGGFDAGRYPRPQIEDIELGYRLRAAGHSIRIEPSIQVKHLKRWTLGGMIRTDVTDRGIPWMRLLLERSRAGTERSLNLGHAEKARTALAALVPLALVLAAVLGRPILAALSLAPVAIVVATSWPMYRWFADARGPVFAAGVVPMQLLYYWINAVCAAVGSLSHVLSRPGTTGL